MISRIFTVLITSLFIITIPSFAQQSTPTPEELQRKIQELQQRVDAMANTSDVEELKRQIDVLTQEIEKLRAGEKTAVVSDDQVTYGMGSAASKVYRSEPGVSIGGYGEMLYENFSSERDNGADSNATDQLDFLRAVIYTGYKFNDKVIFNSETEVEHATTDDGIGEVALEFAYLDFLVRPEFNVRGGLVLVPMGLINELHEPTAYLGAKRPGVEQAIIPSTWREAGFGAFGDIGQISYRAYVITGLDSEEFSSAGIRSGRQGGAKAKAEDFALVGRLDWQPFEGTIFGGSVYSGNSGQSEDYSGKVTLTELHADAKMRGLMIRALWANGRIGDAAEINAANGLSGSNSVGSEFGGWYAEAGYDLGGFLRKGDIALIPYLRYEQYNSQESVPSGFALNPALDRATTTIGIAFKPIPQTVIKFDFQNNDNDAETGVDQFNVSMGYIF